MKKTWLVVIGVALILAAVTVTGCGSEGATLSSGSGEFRVNLNSQQEGIWVNGEGRVLAVPDVAILRLGIEAQEASVAEARAQAAEAMEQVKAALTGEGVDEKDIQTQYFNIQRVTRWDDMKGREIVIGYRVTNMVTAKVREIDNVGTVIDAVAIAGGDLTRVDSIGFTVDDPSAYYQEARQIAVVDAGAKAKQLAEVAGVNLGKPTYISENAYIPGPIYHQDVMMEKAAGVPAAETPISPGEMEITLNVQLGYAIVD
jgi:uncharacterized protein YggE